jgi:hypothetical protein
MVPNQSVGLLRSVDRCESADKKQAAAASNSAAASSPSSSSSSSSNNISNSSKQQQQQQQAASSSSKQQQQAAASSSKQQQAARRRLQARSLLLNPSNQNVIQGSCYKKLFRLARQSPNKTKNSCDERQLMNTKIGIDIEKMEETMYTSLLGVLAATEEHIYIARKMYTLLLHVAEY